MQFDKVPFLISLGAVGISTEIPGPTKQEWSGAAAAVVALIIREVIWWFRNRKR